MEAAKSRSSFMSLSPELRNRVYDLVMIPNKDGAGGVEHSRAICVQQAVVYVYDSDETDDDNERIYGEVVKRWRNQPAITRVSRQVRAETLPMYYGLNEFIAYNWDPENEGTWEFGGFFSAHRWLSRMGRANAALIKQFAVHIPRQHQMCVVEVMEELTPSAFGLDEAAITILRECDEECGGWHAIKRSGRQIDGSGDEIEGTDSD